MGTFALADLWFIIRVILSGIARQPNKKITSYGITVIYFLVLEESIFMKHNRIAVFFNGIPDLESYWHIVKNIHVNTDIEVVIFACSALISRESRLSILFNTSGIKVIVRPNRLMKCRFWYARALKNIDRIIVIADPVSDESSYKKRSSWIAAQGIPTTFLQHGAIQEGVTYMQRPRIIPFHSDQIILWQPLSICNADFMPDVSNRVTVGGFIKKPIFPPYKPTLKMQEWLAQFQYRLLICHTLMSVRQNQHTDEFYEIIQNFLHENTSIGVIIRPHRGKKRFKISRIEKRIQSTFSNVCFSYNRTGELKGTNITDVLTLVDGVISTPSTVLLDSLYLDRPTAQIARDSDLFDKLPQVTNSQSILDFISNGWTEGMTAVREYYGDTDSNISYTAKLISDKVFTGNSNIES